MPRAMRSGYKEITYSADFIACATTCSYLLKMMANGGLLWVVAPFKANKNSPLYCLNQVPLTAAFHYVVLLCGRIMLAKP
jgi:hypothetical protein